jgi:hypothetical protein
MIRSFYGLTQNPFDCRELELLTGQQEIVDTLKVGCVRRMWVQNAGALARLILEKQNPPVSMSWQTPINPRPPRQ